MLNVSLEPWGVEVSGTTQEVMEWVKTSAPQFQECPEAVLTLITKHTPYVRESIQTIADKIED